MQFTATIFAVAGLAATVSAQAATNCSVKGYDKGTHAAFIDNTTVTAPVACKALCIATTAPKCASFAVGTPGCLLYNVTVMANVNPVNTSMYTFYDASCAL